MKDGHTRKVATGGTGGAVFLARHRAAIVALDGAAAGSEYALETEAVTIGRGPDVELAFEDDAMSRRHAAFEVTRDGFRIRDLGSTNGTTVNGSAAPSADLKHGDKIGIGAHTFQYVVESRSARAYTLSDD